MKKIVCLLMALTMLLALFAGCGKAEAPAAPAEKKSEKAASKPSPPAETIKEDNDGAEILRSL